MSLRQLVLVTLLAAAPVALIADSRAPRDLTGHAYDREGQLRYREVHDFASDARGPRQVTTYFGPDGREIGRMEADYSVNAFAPSYRMVDYRHDTEEVARRDGNQVYIEHRAGMQRRSKTVTLEARRPLIVGPGFNQFIRAYWDELVGGKTLVSDFVIPSRLQVVAFRIRHAPDATTGRCCRFVVSADNVLLRMLAPELRVEYDPATKELVSYSGPSNVNDDRNKQQHVEIRFDPPAAVAAAAAASR